MRPVKAIDYFSISAVPAAKTKPNKFSWNYQEDNFFFYNNGWSFFILKNFILWVSYQKVVDGDDERNINLLKEQIEMKKGIGKTNIFLRSC